jgi:hypothetical protein
MKILYASVIELHAGWGAEVFVNDALRAHGHETYCIDYKLHRHAVANEVLNSPTPEVFLLQRGDGFPIPILDSLHCPRFFWASELVARCRDQDRLFVWGKFDHVWVRGVRCREELLRLGWLQPHQCSLLLSGYDSNLHQLPLHPVSQDIDVLFVGSLTPRRLQIIESLHPHFKVHVEMAFGKEMVSLFHRAKIVLNIHAEEFRDVETRVFEVLGCGAFLLSEALAEENPFGADDLVTFDGIEDLKNKITYYLSHTNERQRIAVQGHETARTQHTWAHRALQIAAEMARVQNENSARGNALTTRHEILDEAKLRQWALIERIIPASQTTLKCALLPLRAVRRLWRIVRKAIGVQP